MTRGWLYLIRPVGMPGPIKIGFSLTPERRREELMAWSPFKLEIIAWLPATYEIETRVHQRLALSHSHHEWFLPSPKVLRFVSMVSASVPLEAILAHLDVEGDIRPGRSRSRQSAQPESSAA